MDSFVSSFFYYFKVICASPSALQKEMFSFLQCLSSGSELPLALCPPGMEHPPAGWHSLAHPCAALLEGVHYHNRGVLAALHGNFLGLPSDFVAPS